MNKEIKNFIEDNIGLIDKGDYCEFYKKAFVELSFKQFLDLEEMFLISGVTEAKLSNNVDLLEKIFYRRS